MLTKFFEEDVEKQIAEMAKKGEVYVFTSEINHKSGRYQTVRTALVRSPEEAMKEIRFRKRRGEKAGVPWEYKEYFTGDQLEIGETVTLAEATITHRNGDKSGRVDIIKRVR